MASKGLPSPPLDPLGKMPSSSAKRRQFLRESEDDTGPMYIEQYIYRRDRYRSTSAAFPFPLPLLTRNPPKELQEQLEGNQSLRSRVKSALNQHGIEAKNIALRSQGKPGYPNDGGKPVPALRILVDAGPGNPLASWSAARRDITNILDEFDFQGVEVEIQDPSRVYQPSIFAIPPAHPAVNVFKTLRAQLLRAIIDTIGLKWGSLSLYLVGRTSGEMIPTVLVSVEPLSNHDWNIFKASLEAIVDRHQGKTGSKLPVDIVPGGWVDAPPSQAMPGESFLDDFNSHPKHGTSIGVRGEIGGGTLGGFFVMRSPSKRHIGFLTNSHVVAPPSSAKDEDVDTYHRFGLAYKASDDNPGRTWVQYFAEKDVTATILAGEAAIRNNEEELRLKTIEETTLNEIGRLVGLKKTSMERNKDRLEKRIKQDKLSLSQARRLPVLFGRTILSSGRALTSDHKTLDYAFVESSAAGNTTLPTQSEIVAGRINPAALGSDETLQWAAGDRYSGFSRIQAGKYYWKIGRTTRITGGICNGVESWIKPSYEHTLWNDKGEIQEIRRAGKKKKIDPDTGKALEAEDTEYNYASEWVIMNVKGNPKSFSAVQEDFCQSGDSGSLIIDASGNVAGILFGELRYWCGPPHEMTPYSGAGLVTDINEVIKFMKAALGWPANALVDVLTFPSTG